MKKLVFVVLVATILAGCITVSPKGELGFMPVELIGKANQDTGLEFGTKQ